MEDISEIENPRSEIQKIPTMAKLAAESKQPEVLFWVGCAGSFDERAQKITPRYMQNTAACGYQLCSFWVPKKSCTGDPAKRARQRIPCSRCRPMVNIKVLKRL